MNVNGIQQYNIQKSNNLVKKAFQTDNTFEKMVLFREALELNQYNSNALLQLGLYELGHNYNKGFILLEKAFESSSFPKIPLNTPQAKILTGLIARYYIENKIYDKAHVFLQTSLSCCSQIPHLAQQIQLTTLITGYPKSIIDAQDIISNFHKRIDLLLQQDSLDVSYIQDKDPYIFCMINMFYVEIYHEADIKNIMHKFYTLAVKAFPHLHYRSSYIENISNLRELKNIYRELPKESGIHKYNIGIASAFFSENTSVLADFQGVIDRLPENRYNITYIYFNETGNPSSYLTKKKHVLIYNKNDNNWLEKARKDIEHLNLDLLLYLDSTMSSFCQRMLMSKVARVQAVSHGHPVTSGIRKDIVDYYVSWGAAELDYDKAQSHYTEKLLLLPNDRMHQYYNNRVSNGISLINNQKYDSFTREDFSNDIPKSGHWYLCMQKSFKRHPEFDFIVKDIMVKDPEARIILHNGANQSINKIILDRYKQLNIDLDRIHLIEAQPHHKLMALYVLSDIILDSYYAGGCTTTREALEVGGLVVTLPTNYLGGRWSLAYYKIMGVMDLVAHSKEEYVDIAVDLGKSRDKRLMMKDKILENVNKLFYKQEAVDAWDKILEKMILNFYKTDT
tara:strand:+ start:892 stop:2754 length:1863 start_codon:yes stop_codon:yes gene_type:complete